MSINDKKVLEIIKKINNLQIDMFYLKKEMLEAIIEYNSPDNDETIFEEFLDYIQENKNYSKSLEDYIDENYKEHFIKFKNIYFLQLRGKIDSLSIEKLLDVSKAKSIEDLIIFCEEYGENNE